MKKFVTLFLPVLFWAVVSISNSLASVTFIDVGLSEIRNMAAKEGKLYFVHFSAEWCMPCQWMEQNTFTDNQLSDFTNQNYLATKLDIDKTEGQWYQNQYAVSTLPTILIFSSQGILLNRVEASLEAEDLLKVFKLLNKPANKISNRPPLALQQSVKILDSPKATLVFARPALVRESNKPIMSSVIYSQNDKEDIMASNAPVFAYAQTKKPTFLKNRNHSSVFTPRSAKEYYIQTGIFSSYKNALTAAKLLEQKFDQPVNFQSKKENGKMQYQVVIGQFKSRAKAADFFNYLRRNDINGILKEKEL